MKGKCPAEKGFFDSLDRETSLLPTEDGWVFDATPSNLSELQQHGTAAATVGDDSKRGDAGDDEPPLPVPAGWRRATAEDRITKGVPYTKPAIEGASGASVEGVERLVRVTHRLIRDTTTHVLGVSRLPPPPRPPLHSRLAQMMPSTGTMAASTTTSAAAARARPCVRCGRCVGARVVVTACLVLLFLFSGSVSRAVHETKQKKQ